jgi:vitamin B12 transporter
MRKKLLAVMAFTSSAAMAQDSLQTTTLKEVVVTGTKFDLPVEKSGKTIYKITSKDLAKAAGKTLADVLNEVPGIQTDGNFGTPGNNVSYYLRGGRNKQTLILIDGVPLNDPSAINAEYDLRYIAVSQIESIEVLKGGLSTLYGTSASAGVISIKLKDPVDKFSGSIDASVGSFGMFSQNLQVSGVAGKMSYLVSGNNVTSEGFSSAQDNNELVEFDKDGFSRQNGLIKLGLNASEKLSIRFQTAYEQFDADYDDYEFADAANSQTYKQIRFGLSPEYKYGKGEFQAKIFYNTNERFFESAFPSESRAKNLQTELTHRHKLSSNIQVLSGVNFQRMAMEEKNAIDPDSANFNLFDPYTSLLVDLRSGLNIHAGVRLNTHSVYGSKLVYNLNPSFVLNQQGTWHYKVLASVATSYITPSLYQLYSSYGNKDLKPEESLNYEAGFSVYKSGLTFNAVWFKRNETDPIDFVALYDEDGNYIGGRYGNLTDERTVDGWEFNVNYDITPMIDVAANFTSMDTDKHLGFYRIPKTKYGATLNIQPLKALNVSLKYNYTGERTTFDFASFSEVKLDSYQLVDIFASYTASSIRLTVYGAVNNVFDESFIAQYGYTTRGRNVNVGARFSF